MSHRVSPDTPYLDRLNGLSFEPIFILGDHRSGTTLLYRMLAASGCFTPLTAYDVICSDELLHNAATNRTEDARRELEAQFRGSGHGDRMIDAVPISWDLPEEYGFVIEDHPRPCLKASNIARFLEMCRKLRFLSESDHPLLLKNPWDVMNFRFIVDRVPQARLIFLHRHPSAVASSQLRAIRSLLNDWNPYVGRIAPWYRRLHESRWRSGFSRMVFSSRLPIGSFLVVRHLHKVARYFLENVDSIPEDRRVSVRYEDLCQDPDTTIRSILEFLDLEVPNGQDFTPYVHPRNPCLEPSVRRLSRPLKILLRKYLETNGY